MTEETSQSPGIHQFMQTFTVLAGVMSMTGLLALAGTQVAEDIADAVNKRSSIDTFLKSADRAVAEDATPASDLLFEGQFHRIVQFRKNDALAQALPILCAVKEGKNIPLMAMKYGDKTGLQTLDPQYSISGISKWAVKDHVEKMRLQEVQAFCDTTLGKA